MTIKRCGFCLFSGAAIFISACSGEQNQQENSLPVKAVTSEIRVVKSDRMVSDFLAKEKAYESAYASEICFNITPEFVSLNSSYEIFKYDKSTASYLMYDSEIYETGAYFGGFGITGMALADLDKDSRYELYYTFSSGSGRHLSQIGYFNPATEQITVFDYSYMDHDLILTTNNSGDLCVNRAVIEGDSFVYFTATAEDEIGRIELKDSVIALNMDGQEASTE